MAKCIRYASNGVILRMNDADALSIVLSGAATFTSKSKWKAYVGDTRKALAAQAAAANKVRNNIVHVPNPNKKRKPKAQRHAAWMKRLAA